VATRKQFRNRVFLIVFAVWTAAALPFFLFNLLTDQGGHPSAASVGWLIAGAWLIGAVLLALVWMIWEMVSGLLQ